MQYFSVLYYKSSKHDNNHKEEFILEVGDNLLEAFVGLGQLAGNRLVLEGVGLLDEDLGHGGVQHQPLLNTSFELGRGDDDVSEEVVASGGPSWDPRGPGKEALGLGYPRTTLQIP